MRNVTISFEKDNNAIFRGSSAVTQTHAILVNEILSMIKYTPPPPTQHTTLS